MLQLDKIENLVLSGGGLLGISYIGLFRYLEEHHATQQIKTVVGSSAGAIFGMLFILGYSHWEMYEKFKDMKFTDYVPINADSLLNLIKVKGANSCSIITQFFKDALLEKAGNENITLRELYTRFGITFRIGATNITTSRFELLEHTSHPDLPVYLAIKASIAVPFVFEPVIIGEYLYCDGGLCDNLPIEYVISNLEQSATAETEVSLEEEEKNIKTSAATSAATNTNTIATTDKEDLQPPPLKTLGVYLTTIQECISPANYLNASIFQYLNAVLHATFLHPTLMKKAKENVKNYKIIIIEIPCDIMTFLKLSATRADVDNIIAIAYETVSKECQI